MKKIILLAIAAFFALPFTHAADIFLGPKIGINFSTLRITDATDAQRRAFNDNKRMNVGYTTGINFFYRFNNYVALQNEVNVDMKGLRYVNGNTYNITRVTQMEFPLMVKAGYGNSNFMVYGSLGPDFYANLAGKVVIKNNDTKIKSDLNFNSFRRGDVGLLFGLGGMYIMNKGAIDLELRYNLGLLRQDNPIANPNAKWNALQLTFAYLFKIREHSVKVTEK